MTFDVKGAGNKLISVTLMNSHYANFDKVIREDTQFKSTRESKRLASVLKDLKVTSAELSQIKKDFGENSKIYKIARFIGDKPKQLRQLPRKIIKHRWCWKGQYSCSFSFSLLVSNLKTLQKSGCNTTSALVNLAASRNLNALKALNDLSGSMTSLQKYEVAHMLANRMRHTMDVQDYAEAMHVLKKLGKAGRMAMRSVKTRAKKVYKANINGAPGNIQCARYIKKAYRKTGVAWD